MEAVAQPGSRLAAQPDSRTDELVSPGVGPVVVSVRGLCRSYATGQGTITAIDNLNFEIAKGEFLAIVGPSGCG
ncbi:MAG TPA: hypothetical protein PK819_11490, partial [Thermomicrobiales bacterium]|nr:hypothetical protein [Thermomicrobiales bacterium]